MSFEFLRDDLIYGFRVLRQSGMGSKIHKDFFLTVQDNLLLMLRAVAMRDVTRGRTDVQAAA